MISWPWKKKEEPSVGTPAAPSRGPRIVVDDAFADAQRQQQAGSFAMAESLYRNILEYAPDHAGTVHFLGVAVFQQGRTEEGLALVRRSIEMAGDDANFHKNFFSLLRHARRTEEALAVARRVLELDDTCVEANLCVGDETLTRRQYEQAAACYQRALAAQKAGRPGVIVGG